jgi:hypothetical protein
MSTKPYGVDRLVLLRAVECERARLPEPTGGDHQDKTDLAYHWPS